MHFKLYPRSCGLFDRIVAKLCTTEHQSCQELETLSVGQSIAITDSMFNFGKFSQKNDITFDLTEIERK